MHPFITHYNQTVLPKLKEGKQYASSYLVPRVTKVSINCGIGDVATDDKAIESVAQLLASITGQRPAVTKARKAIAGFKIRQGMTVGLKVTLRGERMHDFLMKLIQITLPRTRDFRGLKPSAITSDGNLNLGIKDSMIFPEASQDGTGHGVQVTLISNAKTREEAVLLYESLGFVFQAADEVVQPRKKGKHYNLRKK